MKPVWALWGAEVTISIWMRANWTFAVFVIYKVMEVHADSQLMQIKPIAKLSSACSSAQTKHIIALSVGSMKVNHS